MSKPDFSKSTVETVRQLVPIDDVMFQKICEDREVCEEIISAILGEPVTVIQVVSQESIGNLQGRSVRLDCLCKLKNGVYVNVEVQKPDNDDHEARVRYNASVITANETPKSVKFRDIARVIVIYITKFDLFHDNYPIYHIDRTVRETGKVRDDGFTEIYVNAAVKKYDSDLNRNVSDLMDLFVDRERYDIEKFPCFSKRKNTFVNTEKGEIEMCEKVENLFREREKETILNLLFESVQDGAMKLTYAADKAGLSITEFKHQMQIKGYNYPTLEKKAAAARRSLAQ
ncbi:MAG: PD-(D/E)XK nuclease family transposase [Flexilinea sp.]|nr:PD-(D/E)XK nuclease family transposase [Flexilinea sp.]